MVGALVRRGMRPTVRRPAKLGFVAVAATSMHPIRLTFPQHAVAPLPDVAMHVVQT